MTKTSNKGKKSYYIHIMLLQERENENCTQTMVLDTLAVSRCTRFRERVSIFVFVVLTSDFKSTQFSQLEENSSFKFYSVLETYR